MMHRDHVKPPLSRTRRRVREESDERLQRIIERIADAIVVVDQAGRVEFSNPAAEQLLGRQPASLVGSLFGFPVVDGETAEIDLRSGRVAEMRVVELSWAGRPAWLASLRDVTDRREAEEAARRLWRERTLREAAEKERRRLQDLLVRAPAGILTTRGSGHVCVFANPVMQQLAAGRTLAGRPLAEALPELATKPFLSAFDTVYGEGTSRNETELEIRLSAPDNSEVGNRFLDLCWEPLLGEDGGVEGVMCFAHDVTAQVNVLRELERAMERLREDERQKDHFMAMLGHELRNPLAGIDSGLRLLEYGADPEQAQWAVAMMRRQVSQVSTLLDDLLDVARVARGKLELQRQPVALREIVASAAEAANPRLREQGQEILVTLPEEPLLVDGDRARLEQVLANLLANASRYSDSQTEVRVRLASLGDTAVVEVADRGMGIDPAMLERIFEPFVQAANGGHRAGGLGIGLTLVKQLVELHGGSVSVRSEGPGRGSTFSVHLPLVKGQQVVTAPPAPEVTVAAATRVLVVDDNEDAGRALAELLGLKGCATSTVASGEDALAAARAAMPDVVLLDLDLPDLSGYEVAERLRQEGGLERLLIVAVSGFGDEQARDRCRQSGIDHHLLKPVDLEELLRILAERSAASD
jgi:signal transduction histidine kinase/ActR/RegA family two-component response regulator